MQAVPFIVYIKKDTKSRIWAVDSSAFIGDGEGWIKIDSGSDFRCKHAQGNYFPEPIHNNNGIYRYITAPITDDTGREHFHTYEYEGETWGIYKRTEKEMDSDYREPVIDTFELDLMADHEYRLCCLELGI